MEESIPVPTSASPAEDGRAETGSTSKPKTTVEDVLEESSSKPIARKLYENAVDDAQYLMAYASSKCPEDIDEGTLRKLIQARHRVENNTAITAKEEAEFWIAYQDLWKLVRPVTAECIKATESPAARKTINGHIGFTVVVLIALLLLQIYWVIGSELTTRLADLLQQETELSEEIRANQEEYNAIELRFKQNESDSENFSGYYEYFSSPGFERDTADNLFTKARLETELSSLISQRERNNAILLVWSKPWQGFVQSTSIEEDIKSDPEIIINDARIEQIDKEIENISKVNSNGQTKIQIAQVEIAELENTLRDLNKNPESNAAKISELNSKLSIAYSVFYSRDQLNQERQYLEEGNKQERSQIVQEKSRQAYLGALFILTILQSYLLPLFYGLLGAGTSALRSLSREIDQVIFSDKRRIQHVLRIALGALAGIMVGWFSFLYESPTFLGSVSPLAIAFLVGYNIELFFSLMDIAINWVNKRTQKEEQQDSQKASSPATV